MTEELTQFPMYSACYNLGYGDKYACTQSEDLKGAIEKILLFIIQEGTTGDSLALTIEPQKNGNLGYWEEYEMIYIENYECNLCGAKWKREWDTEDFNNDFTMCPNCLEFDFEEEKEL